MAELKIAVGLSSLKQPLKQALHTAAEMGANGVEIDVRNALPARELGTTGLRHLRKIMSDLNLRVAAVRFPTRRGYDVAADLERRIDATKEAMKFAYDLGAAVVINSVGFVPESETHPSFGQLKSSLEDLAKYGQHVGAMLACETGSEPLARLHGFLENLHERAIGINLNPGQLIVNENYELDDLKGASSSVLNVTARDATIDLSAGRGIEVPFGSGSAEFPEILGVLEERQYRGWFVVDRLNSANPIREISDAISYLRAL